MIIITDKIIPNTDSMAITAIAFLSTFFLRRLL
jgi:hypothetical protein